MLKAAITRTERGAGGFSLLRYFSVASLIAIALALVGLGYSFRTTALEQLIKAGEDNNAGIARTFAVALKPHYIPLIEAAQKSSTEEVKANPRIAAVPT